MPSIREHDLGDMSELNSRNPTARRDCFFDRFFCSEGTRNHLACFLRSTSCLCSCSQGVFFLMRTRATRRAELLPCKANFTHRPRPFSTAFVLLFSAGSRTCPACRDPKWYRSCPVLSLGDLAFEIRVRQRMISTVNRGALARPAS